MILLYVLLGAVALYILFLAACSLAVNPKKEYEEHSSFYRALLNGVTVIALWIMRVRVHVSGVQKLPADTRVLFVSNHRSNFDPIVTWHALKKWNIAFISKAGNFKIPIFGRLIRRCCFMVIDRENPRNAIKTIQKAARIIDKGEASVGVYPEGTRNRTLEQELLPFHNGVFKVAQKAGAPIAVLTVCGTEKIHKNYPLRASHVYVDVVDVIPAERAAQMRTEVIGQEVRTKIMRQIKERET